MDAPESTSQQKESTRPRFTYRNPEVLAGDWMRSVIFSNNSNYEDFTRLQLSLDDAHGPASIPAPQKPPKLKTSIMTNNSSTLDSYNLSNDKLYEVRREQKRTVRQTFGHIEVQHSYPAMKLQFPWVSWVAIRKLVSRIDRRSNSTRRSSAKMSCEASIVCLSNFRRISLCHSPKCGPPSARRIRLDAS